MRLPPICLTYTKFSDWNFFLANHVNFNLDTVNCDWVGSIQEKQPLKRYDFSIYFINHFACFCDKNSLDLCCYVQPWSVSLRKCQVFLRKSNHPVFINIALVFYFFASSNGLVVSG